MTARVELIVGLGNPGAEYEHTPHNAGFWFVDQLAREYHTSFKHEKKFHGDVARFSRDGEDVWLLKPDTFMNNSGQAVQALARFYKIERQHILVVHDELDLDPGTIRLKKDGGHGGHNGLRDIINKMAGNDFLRLRIGIGHPGDSRKVTGHVLNKVKQDDRTEIDRAMDRAVRVMPDILNGALARAMNELHTDK